MSPFERNQTLLNQLNTYAQKHPPPTTVPHKHTATYPRLLPCRNEAASKVKSEEEKSFWFSLMLVVNYDKTVVDLMDVDTPDRTCLQKELFILNRLRIS